MSCSPFATPRQRLLWLVILLSGLIAFAMNELVFRSYFIQDGFRLAADLDCFRANGAYLGRHIAAAADEAVRACSFKYPPPFLLLATPFSWLSPLACFIVWTIASLAVFLGGARTLRLKPAAIWLSLLAPPVLMCLAIAQNGVFLSMALLLSLAWAESAPVAAGIAAGFLVMKPQIGILLPICYLAARNWRAIAATLASAAALCVITTISFGFGVWEWFLHAGVTASKTDLAAPWPQSYQHIMITPFMLLRGLGSGLNSSWTVQLLCSLSAAWAVWMLWRAPLARRNTAILPLTLCLSAIATPYAYVYDLPALGLSLTAWSARQGWQRLGPLAWFWGWMSLYVFISVSLAPPGALCLGLLIFWLWREGNARCTQT
jgi:hypothetical protein